MLCKILIYNTWVVEINIYNGSTAVRPKLTKFLGCDNLNFQECNIDVRYHDLYGVVCPYLDPLDD